jgi:hypothetical protein
MRIKFLISLIVLLVLIIRLNGQYSATYVPDSLLRAISIDGDLSEWRWMDKNVITNDLLMQGFETMNTKENLDINLRVGWNETINKLFVLVSIKDNSRKVDYIKQDFWVNDAIELAFTNSVRKFIRYGENPVEGTTVKLFILFPTKEHSAKFVFMPNCGADWILNDDYIRWYCKVDNVIDDGPYKISFEFCFNLWDKWNIDGPYKSIKSILRQEEKIGLTIAFDDADAQTSSQNQLQTMSGRRWYWQTNEMTKFYLEPKQTIEDDWDAIRLILKNRL